MVEPLPSMHKTLASISVLNPGLKRFVKLYITIETAVTYSYGKKTYLEDLGC